MDKLEEMLYAISFTLIIMGLLGFFSSPIFGIFNTTFLQNSFFILSGVSVLGYTIYPKKIESGNFLKHMAVFFGALAYLSIVLPVNGFLSVVTSDITNAIFYAFLSVIFLYMYFNYFRKKSKGFPV